ncbi:MAG: ribosomal protein S18-alanine N-acetyltransferase [Candidatus Rariloculaceae bacterium]
MSASVQPQTQLRAMRPADLRAVAEVERSSYKFPWTIGIVRDCLLAGYHSQVLELDGIIGGYSIMSAAAAEAHLLNLCVHPSYQRLGFGRRLLNAALLRAEELSVEKVFLEVRPSNNIAIALYRSAGFELTGARPSYYQSDDGREDAVIFAATINHSY